MAKTKVKKKAVCAECGVDKRPDTAFCYNCGRPLTTRPAETAPESNGVVAQVDAETQAALDDLAKRLEIDTAADDKLAKAAAERRKARVSQRKSDQFTWEPPDESSGSLIIFLAILITVIVAGVVFVTVFWK